MTNLEQENLSPQMQETLARAIGSCCLEPTNDPPLFSISMADSHTQRQWCEKSFSQGEIASHLTNHKAGAKR